MIWVVEEDWTSAGVEEPWQVPLAKRCSGAEREVSAARGVEQSLVSTLCFSLVSLHRLTCFVGAKESFWPQPLDVPSFVV